MLKNKNIIVYEYIMNLTLIAIDDDSHEYNNDIYSDISCNTTT